MSWRIKIHRKITQWERYEDHNTFRVFLHILLSANHKANKWQGILIEKWSFITSFDKLSVAVWLSLQQVRTAISKLESTWEITRKATSKRQAITVCRWENYQNEEEEATSKTTDKQQTNNKQITTNKNDKNEENEKLQSDYILKTWKQASDLLIGWWYAGLSIPLRRSEDLEKARKLLDKKWVTDEERVQWVRNYVKDIEKRNKENSYSTHRFKLLEFLTRKWWLVTFI